MHKSKLYIVFSLILSGIFAQDQEDVISRHRPGIMWYNTGINPEIPEKGRKYDRLIFDIVYNDWISKEQKPFKVLPSSIGFNVNLMFDKPITKNNTFSFGYGVSYNLFRVDMKNFFVRNQISNDIKGPTEFGEDISKYGIKKSIFKVNSFSIPLELRFKGKNWKHSKIIIGGKISYLFRPSTTLRSKSGTLENQQKVVGFYDFNHFVPSAHIRFGRRNLSLFASYNFIPLFKDKASVQLNPFQFGLSISLY